MSKLNTAGTARMTSGTLSETNANCKLDFWYYITGMDLGSLSVLTSQAGANATVGYISGSQGAAWRKAEMILGAGSDYSVRQLFSLCLTWKPPMAHNSTCCLAVLTT